MGPTRNNEPHMILRPDLGTFELLARRGEGNATGRLYMHEGRQVGKAEGNAGTFEAS